MAIIKDPRKDLKPVAPMTQEQVAKQQALQKQQGQVGLVPQKTDGTGYAPESQDDPSAAAILTANARNSPGADAAASVIQANQDAMTNKAEHPKKVAFGAIWALLAGLMIAGAAWVGLQKYGPKPPEHVLRA